MPAYEISNHARPGQESRHNLTYWRYQDYCGIGPGAHGRRGGMATLRHKKPENWLNAVAQTGQGMQDETPLAHAESAAEALLMGLRLAEGIAPTSLAERFGFMRDDLIDGGKVAVMVDHGLMWARADRIGATERGMVLLDGILSEIVRDTLVSA